jgi:hypothetical protein
MMSACLSSVLLLTNKILLCCYKKKRFLTVLTDWGHSSPWCQHVFRVSYCRLMKYYCVVIKKKRFLTVLTDWGHSSPWCLHVFRVSYCRLMKYYCVVIKKKIFYSVNWLRSQFTMMSACLSSVLLSTNEILLCCYKKKNFFTVLTDWGHSSPLCQHIFRVSYCRLMKYYCVVIKKKIFYSVNLLRSQFHCLYLLYFY